MADRTCPCGKGNTDDFKGINCAHYLTNWMIGNGALEPYPAGCYCCEEGRPIRAKDVKSHIFEEQYGLGKTSPPKDGSNCFVYCYKASNDRGHVV
uniref:SWIM-type domain-containing protein n=1 Tax=Globodera rostochiensis TaxID=31243 RepID=A0A914HIT7_GLORO